MKKILILIFLFVSINKASTKPISDGFSEIVENLLPSVVSVASTTMVEERQQNFPQFPEGSPFEEFFKEYFDQQQRTAPSKRPLVGLGSGFIIDKAGIVVTNDHVIIDADEITIIMEDGDEFNASVIGRDDKADLAVLKFDPNGKELNEVEWGDSDTARIGDWAIAIGNPLGFGGTVTAGIVSAIARDIGVGPYVKFIQTDASINRGNSGGPLFNIEGKVIGVNSAIISPTGGNIGLGFAIPSNSAKKIVSQLREFGRTKRGWLGVQIQNVTDEIAESLGLNNNKGAFIASVQENSPAFKSGIEAGDVILKFNNIIIDSFRDLPKIVAETEIGLSVELEVWKKNKLIIVSVELGELDEPLLLLNNNKEKESYLIKEIGIEVRDLTNDDYSKFDLDNETKGIIVTEVDDQDGKLDVNDIIIEVNRDKTNNVQEFKKYILEIKETGRRSILLRVIRDKKTIWITLKYLQ